MCDSILGPLAKPLKTGHLVVRFRMARLRGCAALVISWVRKSEQHWRYP